MPKPIYILGISCYYHDSAAVLLQDGEIIFAAQEERYTRKKHDESFPRNAIQQALKFANISIDDVSAVGFYEKPFLKFFDRILSTFFKTWPLGYLQYLKAMQSWMKEKLWIPHFLRKELNYRGPLFYIEHHESHAASSYYCSGFEDATIVTIDGVGEWATTTIGEGRGNKLTLKKEIHYPHSLGLLYSAITYYLGFKVNSAEYKVMGLAPYGKPTYVDSLRKLIDMKQDGSFRLNMRYFAYERGLRMTGRRLEKLLGEPRRQPESPLTQFHKDVARSLQEVIEEIMLAIVKHAKEVCLPTVAPSGAKAGPSDYLCLAGGVALNCVANGKILRSGLFKDIFIQPAAGDAGGALGVALAIWHRKFNGTRISKMEHAFLGNAYADQEIKNAIESVGALRPRSGQAPHATPLPYERLSDTDLTQKIATLLEGTNVIGWFQGRMEFGPRSLGNRSIIADARNKENWQKVNLKIKFRESFRPFAPTILEERVQDYFDLDQPSSASGGLRPASRPFPFMLVTAYTKPDKRAEIPAVTHVDGSARIQTINRSQNPRYYDLLKAFEAGTGCPVIINTSFNIRGEPIVESPEDAIRCFLGTDMDYLVLGNYLIKKSEVPKALIPEREAYLSAFALD